MFTTDLALKFDPAYEKIARRFHSKPEEFAEAFGKAWLVNSCDMGPFCRGLGSLVRENRNCGKIEFS